MSPPDERHPTPPPAAPGEPGRTRRTGAGAWAATWGVLALAALLAAPWARTLAAWSPPCPLKALTGTPCPTCGLTRAAVLLAEGHPLTALVRFPLPTVAWVALLAGGLLAGLAALSGHAPVWPWPRDRSWPRPLVAGLALALLASWIFNIATGV